MNKTTETISDDRGQLAGNAAGTADTTAGVAGQKVNDARQRLAEAMERASEIGGVVRDKTVAGARATGVAVREHPYQALGVGIGLALFIGYVLGRQCSRNGD